ncbi:MAG: methyltransferase domain-containing protein [Acidimicrobiales bacterium]|jgi:SAM-dependent methyltransferase
MSNDDFQTYFHQRARRFSSFYSSESVSRMLGRGPLFDRLRMAVDMSVAAGAKSVLDVGCGSGPLFAPLAEKGINVTGIDPADNMVALANAEATKYPGLVTVQQRAWADLDEVDVYDVAVALGVYDYVSDPADLLGRMGRAAQQAIGTFPSPGMRTGLRKMRYGMRGVGVYGYPVDGYDDLAKRAGMKVLEKVPLGKAGFVVRFGRIPA